MELFHIKLVIMYSLIQPDNGFMLYVSCVDKSDIIV